MDLVDNGIIVGLTVDVDSGAATHLKAKLALMCEGAEANFITVT